MGGGGGGGGVQGFAGDHVFLYNLWLVLIHFAEVLHQVSVHMFLCCLSCHIYANICASLNPMLFPCPPFC